MCHNSAVAWLIHPSTLTFSSHISCTVWCRYRAVSFLTNIQKTVHSSPVRVKYGVLFVDPASDWYSASIPVIINVMSYNIGPCYNGTQLYFSHILHTSWPYQLYLLANLRQFSTSCGSFDCRQFWCDFIIFQPIELRSPQDVANLYPCKNCMALVLIENSWIIILYYWRTHEMVCVCLSVCVCVIRFCSLPKSIWFSGQSSSEAYILCSEVVVMKWQSSSFSENHWLVVRCPSFSTIADS